MADRVKYFLLGVLFLVVAGVIAYDRWNSAGEPRDIADRGGDTDTVGDIVMAPVKGPERREDGAQLNVDPNATPIDPANVNPAPAPGPKEPAVQPEPVRVEPKPAPPKEEPKAAPDKTHVVRKGDTLEAIAIKYYGSRDGIERIVTANKLGNRNRIFANQKLIIPAKKEIAKEGGSGGTKAAAAKPAASGKNSSRYTVKDTDGDLYAICRRIYGANGLSARVHEVMKLNHLYSRDVKTGTILILPK
jgi:LysM repeat protein